MNAATQSIDTAPLEPFGFRFGPSGAHSSRTMMLGEIEVLLSSVPTDTDREDFRQQIVDFNILNKPTVKARQLTLRHLVDLYSLDRGLPLFRVFRLLWEVDPAAHPVLALTMAIARDPILRLSENFILKLPTGTQITRIDTENELYRLVSDRLSPASRRSYAQNINGTWTQAGYLDGRTNKIRQRPTVTPANLTYALFLAHLEGASGERLFTSSWARLLDQPDDHLHDLAQIASQRGLLVYRRSGGVTEVRFPDYLTTDETEKLGHE